MVLYKLMHSADVPELQVDDSFRWSRDNYNSKQRSLDIWSFIIKLRGRLWYLDQKWSYPGGWTESKKSARLQATAIWTRYPNTHAQTIRDSSAACMSPSFSSEEMVEGDCKTGGLGG